jgi:uncharacterized protein
MDNPQETFKNTTFRPNSFWGRKRKVAYENTLPYQLATLKSTGRYDAFKLEWKEIYRDQPDIWPAPKHLFWESDIAKWIEGCCYFFQDDLRTNVTLKAAVEELALMIRDAQQPDGYLNIHFVVVEPEKRFSNLRDLHELYNAGHLIEAALAHHDFTGTDILLKPIIKMVDLFNEIFGPEPHKRHGYPGHPEIELALLRLYRRTKDPKHYRLAKFFLDERGNPKGQYGRHYYDVEADRRAEHPYQRPASFPVARSYWYQQAHEPILKQKTIEGHSVRAMYLLTAVADLICLGQIDGLNVEQNLEEYRTALYRLWDNMVDKKMYITGGIGAIDQWEGFSIDYFLPSGTDEGGCYAETCAAIGVVMLAERLLQIELDSQFADIMELCLFNAVLTGTSHDGKKFTYVNQLASSDSHPSKREDWFTCACCPPNIARLFGYLGGYFWTIKKQENEKKDAVSVNIHLYGDVSTVCDTRYGKLELIQKSNWPWEGRIEFSVSIPDNCDLKIKLRIPHYAAGWALSPAIENPVKEAGYLLLTSEYLSKNHSFTLTLPLTPRFISPHPYTNQQTVALARGPIIYCVEDVDNPWVTDHFKSVIFDPYQKDSSIREDHKVEAETGEEYVALTAQYTAQLRRIQTIPTFTSIPLTEGNTSGRSTLCNGTHDDHGTGSVMELLRFIPYYFRANRGGRGQMRVGLRKPEREAYS